MSYHNTIFSQILKLVPRHEFSSLSKKHDGKRRSDAMRDDHLEKQACAFLWNH